MAAGGPGDHPLSDIIRWNLPTYGEAADRLILKIAALCSSRELEEWWQRQIGWQPNLQSVAEKSERRHQELLRRAQQNGWEMATDDV
jgi:hypothetical protein